MFKDDRGTLLTRDDKFLYSKSLIRRMEYVDGIREEKRKAANKRWDKARKKSAAAKDKEEKPEVKEKQDDMNKVKDKETKPKVVIPDEEKKETKKVIEKKAKEVEGETEVLSDEVIEAPEERPPYEYPEADEVQQYASAKGYKQIPPGSFITYLQSCWLAGQVLGSWKKEFDSWVIPYLMRMETLKAQDETAAEEMDEEEPVKQKSKVKEIEMPTMSMVMELGRKMDDEFDREFAMDFMVYLEGKNKRREIIGTWQEEFKSWARSYLS